MTSKISFFKMAAEESRKVSWLTAVQLLIFGLLIPFRVLLVMASLESSQIEHSRLEKIEVLCRNIGYDQYANTIFIVAAGIICAYAAFHYVQSAAKLDFYHSLAVRRETLFAVKYLAGMLTFCIAYLASQFLAVVFATVFDCMTWSILYEMILASVQGVLFFLCSYSGAILAVMLTGKMLTSILATGVLGGYLPLVWMIVIMFQQVFFSTIFVTGPLDDPEVLRFSSPWAMCLFYRGDGRMGVTGSLINWKWMLATAAVSVLLTLLAAAVYRIRKTEAVGRAIAFPRLETLVKLLLTIPAAILAAMVAYELYDSLLWEVVFLVLFGTLACMIMEFIYRWDIRQTLMHKGHIGITVVLAAIIFFSFRLDTMGIDDYLPEKEEIAAMSVKNSMELFLYEGAADMEETFSFSGCSKEALDYLETENFDPIYRLAQEGVENAKKKVWEGEIRRIYLKYHLKNGKEIYRTYEVEEELYEVAMEELLKDPELKTRFYPILNWTEEYQETILWGSAQYGFQRVGGEEYQEIQFSDSELKDVIEAYRKDLETLSFAEVWQDAHLRDCWLTFYVAEQQTGTSGTTINTKNMTMYPLSEKMEQTMNVIHEME